MRYQGYFLGIALGAVLQTGLPTVAHRIFGAGAGFRVGWRTGGERLVSVVLAELSLWRGDWALGYHSKGFR